MFPDVPVWGKGAILNDAWFIMLFQVFVNPLVNTLNPWYFMYILRKNSVLKKVKEAEGQKDMSQEDKEAFPFNQNEAHTKVEMPIWDPAFSFAGLVNGFYTLTFFQPLLPVSSMMGFFAFTFIYWSHKHRLLRMSTKPFNLSDSIAMTSYYLISLAVMIYGISSMIFDKFNYDKLTIPSIVIFAIGGSSMLFPYYRIFGACASKMDCYSGNKNVQEKNLDSEYKHFRTYFLTEYDRANPITSQEAMQDYMNFLMSKPVLSRCTKFEVK